MTVVLNYDINFMNKMTCLKYKKPYISIVLKIDIFCSITITNTALKWVQWHKIDFVCKKQFDTYERE